jgi:hypothetical protein
MDLDSKKVPELKEMAKELGIQGADGMKKAELIDAISSKAFDAFVKASDAETSEEVAEPKKMKKVSPSGVDESIPGKYRKFMK